jgi:hypothetical protein
MGTGNREQGTGNREQGTGSSSGFAMAESPRHSRSTGSLPRPVPITFIGIYRGPAREVAAISYRHGASAG